MMSLYIYSEFFMLENVRILLQALTDIRAEITRKEGGNPTDLPSLHYIMKRSPGIRDGQPTPRAICGAGWCTKSRCAGTKRRVDTYAHTAILSRQAHLRRASKSSIAAYRLSCGCALKKSIMALAITVRIMRICFSQIPPIAVLCSGCMAWKLCVADVNAADYAYSRWVAISKETIYMRGSSTCRQYSVLSGSATLAMLVDLVTLRVNIT